MSKTKKLVLIGVILIAAAMCAGMLVRFYAGNTEQKKSMIFIPKVIDNENDFWTSVIEGARMAADEYNVEMCIRDSLLPLEKQFRCSDSASGRQLPGAVCQLRWL